MSLLRGQLIHSWHLYSAIPHLLVSTVCSIHYVLFSTMDKLSVNSVLCVRQVCMNCPRYKGVINITCKHRCCGAMAAICTH